MMLNSQTIEGLYALKLQAMAAGLKEQAEQADYQQLGFDERLGLLVDKELAEREDRRRARHLKTAKLRTDAVVEDMDFRHRRGLDRSVLLTLAESGWVANRHNVAIVGPTGVGKTFLACALANAAIRHGHSALYLRAPRMLDELAIARVDGRFARLTASWARIEVLVIDLSGDRDGASLTSVSVAERAWATRRRVVVRGPTPTSSTSPSCARAGAACQCRRAA
jgi:DNA replication protein DnaC